MHLVRPRAVQKSFRQMLVCDDIQSSHIVTVEPQSIELHQKDVDSVVCVENTQRRAVPAYAVMLDA